MPLWGAGWCGGCGSWSIGFWVSSRDDPNVMRKMKGEDLVQLMVLWCWKGSGDAMG